MKKRILAMLLCAALLIPLITVTAFADCGPKLSVNVDVLCAKNIIVTLLGRGEQYGPNSTIQPGQQPEDWRGYVSDDELRAWEAFRDYQDPDGFHFWGEMGWHGIGWGYYPPEEFKIAVYFPDTEVLIVSRAVYETYAFHSDFRVWLENTEYTNGQIVDMDLKKDFDWMEEAWGFVCRVVITLVAELAIAWLFTYRRKSQIRTILGVNLVTQVLLNGMLSLWYFFDGPLDAMLRLAVAEIVVLMVESFFYARRLRTEDKGAGWAVFYALAANLASVVIGWYLID